MIDNFKLPDTLDSNHSIFGGIFLLTNNVEKVSNRYLREITIKQWFMLACLGTFFKDPPTLSELAKVMGVSHQNAKAVANRLVEKGFVKIKKDNDDKRISRISMSEKIYEYDDEMQSIQTDFLNQLFEGISEDDKHIFLKVHNKMLNNLNKIEVN